MYDYSYDQDVKQAEDIKFAKIETYLSLIKSRLDREIPEGNWKIEKSCDAPNTKGDFDEYSCEYSVTSEVSSDFKERQLSIARSFSTKDLYETEQKVTYGMYPIIENVGCSTYYDRTTQNMSGFRCTSGSHDLRYTLKNR